MSSGNADFSSTAKSSGQVVSPSHSRRVFLGDYQPPPSWLQQILLMRSQLTVTANRAPSAPNGPTPELGPDNWGFQRWDLAPLELSALWLLSEYRMQGRGASHGGTGVDSITSPTAASHGEPMGDAHRDVTIRGNSDTLKPLARQRFDLSQHLIVLPTAIARRQFVRALSQFAQAVDGEVLLPELVSLGDLPEHLYDNDQPFAPPLERRLTWISALEQLAPADLEYLLPGYQAGQPLRLVDMAQQIQTLHERLATEVLSFTSVRKRVSDDPQFIESRRWRILEQVQTFYYAKLLELGYWDLQAARNAAIRRGLCRTDRPIVLIGTADLNTATKQMLHAVSPWVTAVVFGHSACAAGFDTWGSLVPEYWQNWQSTIRDDQIKIVDRPIDQAVMAGRQIEHWRQQELRQADETDPTSVPGKRSDETATPRHAPTVIGIPDPEIEPALHRVLLAQNSRSALDQGFSAWSDPGAIVRRQVGETLPGRLLTLVSQFVDDPKYRHFAALVRHPDCCDFMTRELRYDTWLSAVDQFQNDHLPWDVPLKPWNLVNQSTNDQIMLNVHRLLLEWIKPIHKRPQTLMKWGTAIQNFLEAVYGELLLPDGSVSDRELISSTTALHAAAVDLEQLPSEWKFTVTLSELLPLLLTNADANYRTGPQTLDGIELVGWLDLPLALAPQKIITGMNNETVPAPDPAHPYLPQSLRNRLGISDEDRRVARDAYALELIHQSTRDLLLIAGRRNRQNDPLRISRLLLRCDDDKLVRRSQAFFSYRNNNRQTIWLTVAREFSLQQTQPVPIPRELRPVTSLSVTQFREYLKCPYRFYLKCILGLGSVSDQLRELDGGAFGGLAHDVLEAFGTSDYRDSTSAHEIANFLASELERQRQALPVRDKVPAVQIQTENLRLRFQAFAEIQAQRAQQGWQIVAVETKVKLPWKIGDQTFEIVGKIDRIDRSPDGKFAVWDYKTSDAATKVDPAHRYQGNWIDLQLPLYRHLLVQEFPEARQVFDEIQMGYVLLPKKLKEIAFNRAEWSAAELAESDQLAIAVMQNILEQKFWPPQIDAPEFSEEFSAICQDEAMEKFPVARFAEIER